MSEAARLPLRRSFQSVALIWIWALLVIPRGGRAEEAPGLSRVVVLRLDGCCPTLHWPEAETHLVNELAFQGLAVIAVSASDAEAARTEAGLLEVAGRNEADAAMAVYRTGGDFGAVHLVVRGGTPEMVRSETLPVRGLDKPDVAVTCALRGAEAVVAEYEQLMSAETEAGSEADREEAIGPDTFGVIPPPDGFVSPAEASRSPGEENESETAPAPEDGEAPPSGDETGDTPRRNAPAETADGGDAAAGAPFAETPSRRFALRVGGGFGFSSSAAGVRSGFVFDAGYRILKGFIIGLDVLYLPFGADIKGAGDTSTLDLLAVRGWAAWRFRDGKAVQPAIRVGGGGMLAFAEGVRGSETGVGLKQDTSRVGTVSLGAEIRFMVAPRTGIVAGAAVGALFPEIVIRHRDEVAAGFGRPLVEWSVAVEIDLL